MDSDASIIEVLSAVLSQLVDRNDQLAESGSATAVTAFHAQRPPSISIRDYVQRILKYAGCSRECFVLALIYIDRVIQRHPDFSVTSLNVHRLLITSVMLSAKFCEDTYYNNAYYARIGGIGVQEINALEIEMLFLVNFSLNVTPAVFTRYRAELQRHGSQSITTITNPNAESNSGDHTAENSRGDSQMDTDNSNNNNNNNNISNISNNSNNSNQ